MSLACSENNARLKTMTVTGNGNITTDPDTAIIRLGVQTNGEPLSEMQSQNAQITQNIIDSLKQLGINDIKTFQYTIEKAYDYQNGNRIDLGYTVRNILEIRTDHLEQIGTIIDVSVSQGANVVDLISFEVSEPELYYQQALNLAVMNACQKAKSIAINLGVVLNTTPIKIIESGSTPIPYSRFNVSREGSLATPIESGDIKISASVTVIFQY